MADQALVSSLLASMGANQSPQAAPSPFGDPRLASLLPKYQFGQQLASQGLSGQSAYPLQALARTLSGYLGMQGMNDASSDISKVISGRQQAVSDAISGGGLPQTSASGGYAPGAGVNRLNTPPQASVGAPQQQLPASAPALAPPDPGVSAPLPGAVAPAPQQPPTAMAQMHDFATRLIKSGDPVLMQQGNAVLVKIAQDAAEAQNKATGAILEKGGNYNPLTNQVSAVPGFSQTMAANAGATRGAETAAEYGVKQNAEPQLQAALNPIMTARAGGEQSARNASDLTYHPLIAAATTQANTGPLAAQTQAVEQARINGQLAPVPLAPSVPIPAGASMQNGQAMVPGVQALTAAQSAASEAGKQPYLQPNAAATAAGTEQGKLPFVQQAAEAATTGTNLANAGKPLEPAQKVQLQDTLSQHFQDNDQVKQHYETAKYYQNALTAAQGNTKSSDINLIDSIAKMFNPNAIVRQGSYNLFQEHAQGLPSNVVGLVQSFYSNGEHLQPDARQQLLDEAAKRMDASRQTYGQFANFAQANAQAAGLDPTRVVPKFIDPLTAREELARRAAAQTQAPGQ